MSSVTMADADTGSVDEKNPVPGQADGLDEQLVGQPASPFAVECGSTISVKCCGRRVSIRGGAMWRSYCTYYYAADKRDLLQQAIRPLIDRIAPTTDRVYFLQHW